MSSRMSTKKKRQSIASREAPEGDSVLELKPKFSSQNTSTPHSTSNLSKVGKKKASKRHTQQAHSDSDTNITNISDNENLTPSHSFGLAAPAPSPNMSIRKRPVVSLDDSDLEIDLDEMEPSPKPKRSKSATHVDKNKSPKFEKKQSKGQLKRKKSRMEESPDADISWELAVEKARGLPDGAQQSGDEDSFDDDEIDVDAPVQSPKSPKKSPGKKENDQQKAKKKPLNVLQNATKKLKKMTGKAPAESPKQGAKRKHGDEQSNDSKKAKMEAMTKKERKEQRKMSKGNYDLTHKSKKLWEQLRRFDLTVKQRQELSSELHSLVKGKAKELVFAHDTSRVIQCMLKFCSQEEKNALFEELKDDIVAMTKSKYAKFFVRKLLKYGTKTQSNHVFRKLYGSIRKLIKHAEASEIIECAYNDYANAVQRNAMAEEFYGPSFSLFKTSEQRSLDTIMKSNPEKRDSILSNMKEALSALVEKSVLQYSIVHRIFREFFTYAPDKMRAEMIETVREGAIHMLHTRDGSRVAMTCLWYGTAKDRKVMIKSFKTFLNKICKEEYGHLVLAALFDVVDDTKLVQKAVLEEIMKTLPDLTSDQYGRKVVLYLLSPRDPVHFHPDIVKVLQQGDNNPHSKKDAEVRRRELLEFASRPLIQFIKDNCRELVRNNASLLMILTIITHAKSDPTEAMRAVAELAAEPFVAGSLDNQHLVEHPAGHLTLKRLILNDAQRIKSGETVLFSGILLDVLPEGSLKSWAACNRGCFVLLALLELNHPDISGTVKAELSTIKHSLKMMDFKGAAMLLAKVAG